MVWFKIDDNLAFHPKVMEAGNAAMGLWVRAGSWCAQQLSDGWIPRSAVRKLGSDAQANRLVSCGLWQRATREGQDGFLFHEWAERQPTRNDVEKARKDGATRQRRSRERRPDDGLVTRDNSVTGSTPSQRPGPSRPGPTTEDHLGGVSHGGDMDAWPPLYPNRCSEHGDWAQPPNCGACADVRKAAGVHPLRLVQSELQKCPAHDLRYTTRCPGCAADDKAGNA